MAFVEPTDAEIRQILLDTPQFHWPTFAHMPLNCFDIAVGLIVFPGDITQERALAPSYFADYQSDINDDNTCPKIYELTGDELWSDSSLNMRWIFGGIKWACMVDVNGYALYKGHFSVSVGVIRLQNMAEINDIRDIPQLIKGIILSLNESVAQGFIAPINEQSFFEKEINGRLWVIARTLNALNYPEYHALSPIDHRTAINVPVTLDNCWDRDELIPESVEQKHLASLWDFIGQIQFIRDRDDSIAIGSHVREAPGQAEKLSENDLPEW